MKILLITEFFPDLNAPVFSGGVETRAFNISKYLSVNNSVTVIARLLEGQRKKESLGNLEVIRLGNSQRSVEANIKSIFSRLKFQLLAYKEGINKKADIVEGSNFVSYLPAYFIGRKQKIPKVAWYPDVFQGQWVKLFGNILGLFGEVVERLTLSLNWNGFIAISSSTKNKLMLHNPKGKIEVIYCGVDGEELGKGAKFKNPTIIAVSRLVNYKHIDMIIKSISALKREVSDLKLIIIGTGPEENKLKELVSSLNLSSSITFQKNLKREKLLEFLRKSHILCHPSSEEGFGIVVLESLASNTPYVASRIPSISEITKGGLGGELVNPHDQDDLNDKLLSLLENSAKYRAKQKEGLELVKNYYWQNISDQTQTYYQSLIK